MLAAMRCFRERGYDGTTVRDLEDATGLKAPSLYQAFGNKAALFQLAVEHYLTNVVERRITTHLRPDRGLSVIETFFSSTYLEEPDPAHGCLITNSCIEFETIDAPAQRHVRRGLDRMQEALGAQLEHCKATGEIRPDIKTDATAATLLVLYEGLLVMLRTGSAPSAINLETVVKTTIDQLKPHNAKD